MSFRSTILEQVVETAEDRLFEAKCRGCYWCCSRNESCIFRLSELFRHWHGVGRACHWQWVRLLDAHNEHSFLSSFTETPRIAITNLWLKRQKLNHTSSLTCLLSRNKLAMSVLPWLPSGTFYAWTVPVQQNTYRKCSIFLLKIWACDA